MPKGQPRTEEEIQEIVKYYQDTKSIYKTYKRYKSSYNQIKKYLVRSGVEIVKPPIDGKTLLPQLKSESPYIIYNNIYKYKEDILSKDIKSKEDTNKDINKIYSTNYSKDSISLKDAYYIKNLNTILSKMIIRYKNELDKIPIAKMYLHFGTLFDKLNTLTGKNDMIPDSQVIINFYGDDNKVKSMLSKIRESKRVYDRDKV